MKTTPTIKTRKHRTSQQGRWRRASKQAGVEILVMGKRSEIHANQYQIHFHPQRHSRCSWHMHLHFHYFLSPLPLYSLHICGRSNSYHTLIVFSCFKSTISLFLRFRLRSQTASRKYVCIPVSGSGFRILVQMIWWCSTRGPWSKIPIYYTARTASWGKYAGSVSLHRGLTSDSSAPARCPWLICWLSLFFFLNSISHIHSKHGKSVKDGRISNFGYLSL